MSYMPIPESEAPKIYAALAAHRCVACYGPILHPEALYCCGCDDGCEHRDAIAKLLRSQAVVRLALPAQWGHHYIDRFTALADVLVSAIHQGSIPGLALTGSRQDINEVGAEAGQ